MSGIRFAAGLAAAVLGLLLAVSPVARGALTSPFLYLTWERVSTGPVLAVGAAGAWDDRYVIAGPVVQVNGAYEMFYTGSPSSGGYSIGLATSSNGLHWTKDPANPVVPNGQSPAILFEGGQFRMWYTSADRSQILYVNSSDGRTWNLGARNPAVVAGPGWDASFVSSGAVLHNGTGYYLYYTGSSDLNTYQGGLAKSTDGLNWTKDAQNPVLPAGLSGGWDSAFVTPVSLIDAGTVRVLWYVGGTAATGFVWRIGVAVSVDGVHWAAANDTALSVSSQGGWDSMGLSRASVLLISNTLWMWYTGLNASAQWQIGAAQAALPSSPSTEWGVVALLALIVGVGAIGVLILVLAYRERR